MIIAKATQISEQTWKVLFEGPAGSKFKPVTAHNMQDVQRSLYFNTRDYIYDKLIHWLIQRSVALAKHQEYNKLAIQQSLYDILRQKKHSYWRLCETIYVLSDKIRQISPPENSTHRKYYEIVIRPILDFCEPKKT